MAPRRRRPEPQLMEVTPEMAREWVATSAQLVQADKVDRFAAAMAAGKWDPGLHRRTPVVLRRRLSNGNHRMRAVLAYGMPVLMWVCDEREGNTFQPDKAGGPPVAIEYRNVRTGRITSVLEPKEVEAAEPNAHLGRRKAIHQRRTIQRMDDSRRWERVAGRAPKAPRPAPGAEATPAPESDSEPRADGVHHVGGGWYEVVRDGEVAHRVRGQAAAEELTG